MDPLHLYTDASCAARAFSIGAVLLDGAGLELAVCSAQFPAPPWWNAALAERHAALEGLLHASQHTRGSIVLHVDDDSLARVLGGGGRHPQSPADHPASRALYEYVRRIREAGRTFALCRVEWIARGRNRRAHQLAAVAGGGWRRTGGPGGGLASGVNRWTVRDPALSGGVGAPRLPMALLVPVEGPPPLSSRPARRRPVRRPVRDAFDDAFDPTGMVDRAG